MSPLAAAIKLHTGMTKAEFENIFASLCEASIDNERYDWGPAFEIAQRDLVNARVKMRQFLDQL